MSQCAHIFNTFPNDNTPVPFDYNGMTGFFRLPRNWYCKPDPNAPANLIASPNADFSRPVYECFLHQNGADYVFQDLWLSMLYGTTGNNNGRPNGR